MYLIIKYGIILLWLVKRLGVFWFRRRWAGTL